MSDEIPGFLARGKVGRNRITRFAETREAAIERLLAEYPKAKQISTSKGRKIVVDAPGHPGLLIDTMTDIRFH